jgi:hypothetical protein
VPYATKPSCSGKGLGHFSYPNNMLWVCGKHTSSDNTFGGIQKKKGSVPVRKRGN